MNFKLDTRLNNDCFILSESEHSLWLLLNNSHFPWLIIVPKTTQIELYKLSELQQNKLQQQSQLLCEFMVDNFVCDKLNVGAIGNIVKQLHWHIIVRRESDPCWPNVVWGSEFKQPYRVEQAIEIQQKLQKFCKIQEINGLQFAPLQ